MSCLPAVLLLVFRLALAQAHSWIECIDTDRTVVYDNARNFIYGGSAAAGACQGYPYNYLGRREGVVDSQLLVKILKDDYNKPLTHVCKPEPPSYNGQGYGKRVAVHPGEIMYFAYMPNGHVAVDQAARGTLYGIYWTGRPDSRLTLTSDLTDDRLVDYQRYDFDDGNCGQTYSSRKLRIPSGRAGDSFPCVGQFSIPEGIPPGIYSFVWMWKFWDEANDKREVETVGGKYGGAAYSSCFDVEVLDSSGIDAFPPSHHGAVVVDENETAIPGIE
ncbi:hypothetical protein Poli38472_000026 [Pythium oligandrum]|uniref:DUF7492 domain-containing protein n=1 Tax=Pythium oligandrum TaxID=41045 RepID=A0A8K1FGG3_PYTOL|nr:hypothetical protein Poli38472_000026 [Pythium oligandrum]|eukprot:TMW59984.1 hypothetical protein Poli38472_000026 [Pythium oligandrum]